MGAALYAKAAEEGESPNVGGAEAGDSSQASPAGDDDIVDAEVVEDDEQK